MPNVFFLYGNDEFAITRRLKEFEVDFTDPISADMNTARLDARTMSENDLNTAVNAMPFLAPKRLVLLANPSGKYTRPNERKKFEGFVEKVPETARLVIYEIIEPRDIDKHWLVKWIGKNSKLVKTQSFMLPRQWEMAGWILNETKNQGGEIGSPAAAKLAEMVGVNTRQAGQEIAKLLAYVNWERQVRVQDVEAVSIVTAQESVFDFVDALANGDGRSAQHLLHRLLENEDAFSLWGMVIRQFRLLLLAREVLDSRGGKDEVSSALGVHPFVAEKITGQAHSFTLPVLEKIYHRLLEIDEGTKTGQVTLDLALDTLVVELTKGI
ncbi:MAG: DNA polymerase III subunit delta [Anaerolineales bacterium]|nr:DNA polymerase III subunit delta [Anaerolineales bacterium]